MSRPLEWKGRYALVESHTVPVTHSGMEIPILWFDGLADVQIESTCLLTAVTLRMGDLTILSHAQLCQHTADKWIYKFQKDFLGYAIEMPRILNTSYFECRGHLQCCYEPATAAVLFTCKTVVVPMELYRTYVDYYLVDVKFFGEINDPKQWQLWE